jgi:ribosome-associated heat shock protein Hsp15
VRGLNDQRRPAAEAQQLYEETQESRARRETLKEALRLAPAPGAGLKGRPTKKARRQIHRFSEGSY